MRDFLINLFRDETGGPKMGIFNLTHILVLLFVLGLTAFFALFFYKKDMKVKTRILNILLIIVVCLYFGDFFIHPLMNNENALIVDKLPFHLCTSACILIGVTRIWREKFKVFYPTMVILGLIGALMYLTVPTGVKDDYLFCYRTLQTIIYHSVLFMFGVLSLVYEDIDVSFKKIYIPAIVVVIQILISLLANNIYSSESHHYDWYFTTGSSFGINQYLMPFLMFAILMAMTCIIYGLTYLVRFLIKKYSKKEEPTTNQTQE